MKQKRMTMREAREAAGMTLAQLSEKSGIGWNLLQAIEANRTPGSLITRHKIADALRVPLRVIWPDTFKEAIVVQKIIEKDQRRLEEEQGIHERATK